MESSLGKNPDNYKNIQNEINIYKQKPIKFDHFNEVDEKEVRECVEKRKQKKPEVAEKTIFLKNRKTEGI